jgi:hypothetical protein
MATEERNTANALEDDLSRRNRKLLAWADVTHARWRATVHRSLVAGTYAALLVAEGAENRLTAAVLRQQSADLRRTGQQMRVAGLLRSSGWAAFPWRSTDRTQS